MASLFKNAFFLSLLWCFSTTAAELPLEKISEHRRSVDQWMSIIEFHARSWEWQHQIRTVERALHFHPQNSRLRKAQEQALARRDLFLSRQWQRVQQLALSFPSTTSVQQQKRILDCADEAFRLFHSHWPEPLRSDVPFVFWFSEESSPQVPENTATYSLLPLSPLETPTQRHHLRRLMIHEMAHASFQQVPHRALPFWLEEGLALWASGEDVRLSELHKIYKTNELPSLEQFFQWSPSPTMGDSVEAGNSMFSSLALVMTQALLKKQTLASVWTWIKTIPTDTSTQATEADFQTRFQTTTRKLYVESLTP